MGPPAVSHRKLDRWFRVMDRNTDSKRAGIERRTDGRGSPRGAPARKKGYGPCARNEGNPKLIEIEMINPAANIQAPLGSFLSVPGRAEAIKRSPERKKLFFRNVESAFRGLPRSAIRSAPPESSSAVAVPQAWRRFTQWPLPLGLYAK